MNRECIKQTVFVGVSGGVDSSVAASLLQQQGYEVVGVFIRTWQPDWIECTWRDERRDAMRVCAHLDIPFLECDMTDRYRNDVAQYMIDEYKRGRTPNPDVMCNREVKFGGFFDWAMVRGADLIATGHYVQRRSLSDGSYLLQQGIDSNKDQSYFLWTLTSHHIEKSLFPLGGMEKLEVRSYAKEHGLPTESKKDSQGVCFLGEIDMKDFLSHYIDPEIARVSDEKGVHVGNYKYGVLMATHGERLGFDRIVTSPDQVPLYVIEKDVEKNTIVVGPESILHVNVCDEEDTKNIVHLEEINDQGGLLKENEEYIVHIRYHGKDTPARIHTYDQENNTAEIFFGHVDRSLSPGQSIVFYDNEGVLIGGGVIL